ncbi:6-pyruvoyltetrahydropterin/6-carboxytetrahydropterin synthase [Tenacibaculum sp. MAR_2009_124]|uniref:6-pyruvoyl trahydropterin synthase family protein n=1 Tax=Tenacibaculum sp. MAR_2009_124 TaxID=1250059 RepID=UPI00089697FD|nr:6-carboxytetrahydropterin synthase [Tenacibaculum sp. MAR_2009_124]SEB44196.1 6-pyruvoyltetrahydropterin/6-carboxytetrahydropterin synthase [Tenacibaculum sp. MAR_2009_124]
MSEFKLGITRKEHFNAAHRLHNNNWTDEKNKLVFGKCNNPHYHGHNYELEVTVIGYVDEETGYVIDTKILSDIIKNKVLEPFDHKNLNVEVAHFKEVNPTVENIAIVIYQVIKKEIPQHLELKIKLYETPRNFVEYPFNV